MVRGSGAAWISLSGVETGEKQQQFSLQTVMR